MQRVREFTPLCKKAVHYQSDKGGYHSTYGGYGDFHTCHEYTPLYWDLFSERVDRVRKVLEIGVGYIGSSCRMWHEFFPNAEIWGVDNNINYLDASRYFANNRYPRCHWAWADQSSSEELAKVVRLTGSEPFDFVIDDGSHQHEHVVTSFTTLLPFLSTDGVYAVEDVDPMCKHADLLGRHVPPGFVWRDVECFDRGRGLAESCRDGCGGKEKLFVIQRKESAKVQIFR